MDIHLSIASQLEVGLHKTLSNPYWDFGWLDLVKAVTVLHSSAVTLAKAAENSTGSTTEQEWRSF